MLAEAQVTSKGQITLPKAIRERMQLKKGSRVQFVMTETGIELRPAQARSIMDWYGAGKGDAGTAAPDRARKTAREAAAAEVVREMSGD